MHARVNTTSVAPDQLDEFAAALKALVPQVLPQSPGLRSAVVLADRGTGKVILISRWDSEAAGDDAEPAYQEAMRELGQFIAEPPARERYDILLEI